MYTPLKIPIFKKQIIDHDRYKSQILQQIKDYSFAYIKKNTLDIASDYELSRDHPRPYLDTIRSRVKDCLLDFAKISTHYKDVEIRCFFYQQYEKEQYHGWHVHDCQYSGVYYLDMPPDTPKTEYIDPFTNDVCELDVQEGDVIAFPSFLVHRAPPNKIDTSKTIISFNFNFWN